MRAGCRNHGRGENASTRGFILPLILFAAVGLVFVLAFISNMGSSYSNQVAHLDEVTRVWAIGDSVFAQVLARLRSKPWKERFFASRPYIEEDAGFSEGKFDLMVRDTPGAVPERCLVDVFVQARCGRVSRMFFWRFSHEFSLLDAGGKAYPMLFANLSSGSIAIQQAPSNFDSKINGIIAERERNRPDIQRFSAGLQTGGSLKDALGILKIPSPGPAQAPEPEPVRIARAPLRPPSVPPVPPSSSDWAFPSHQKTDSGESPPGGTFSSPSSNGWGGSSSGWSSPSNEGAGEDSAVDSNSFEGWPTTSNPDATDPGTNWANGGGNDASPEPAGTFGGRNEEKTPAPTVSPTPSGGAGDHHPSGSPSTGGEVNVADPTEDEEKTGNEASPGGR